MWINAKTWVFSRKTQINEERDWEDCYGATFLKRQGADNSTGEESKIDNSDAF